MTATAALTACYALPALSVVVSNLPFTHPCDDHPVFITGDDIREATDHNLDAITAAPSRMVEKYSTNAETRARGVSAGWFNAVSNPTCNPTARAAAYAARPGVTLNCDEMPFYSTQKAGTGASLFGKSRLPASLTSWL